MFGNDHNVRATLPVDGNRTLRINDREREPTNIWRVCQRDVEERCRREMPKKRKEQIKIKENKTRNLPSFAKDQWQ